MNNSPQEQSEHDLRGDGNQRHDQLKSNIFEAGKKQKQSSKTLWFSVLRAKTKASASKGHLCAIPQTRNK